MDPLSILGAIAASSQIAQQSYDAIKFLDDIKTKMQNGPKKIRGQIQHIEQFINLLALVIKNTSLQTSEVYSVVKTCSDSAKDINDSLESYLATPDEGKRVKLRKAFIAVRSEKKISSMIADLEREKSLLSLHLQKIDLSLLQTVDLNAKEIKLTVGTVANDVTDMNSRSDAVAPTEKINKIYFIVPNRRVSGFIGREDILNRIEKGLSSESESRIVVLRGLGGQGKTQIALQYCDRARKNNIRAVFWIDATSESTVKKDFKSVLEHIESPADSTQDDQVVASVLNRLQDWNEPWLIVSDNQDDPSSFHLRDFMPSGQHGRILITSRHADTGVLAETDYDIELHELPKDDACDLLIKQSRVSDTASRDNAYAIVDRLGYHALAITQAGSYIQIQKIALSQFMDKYNRQREAILQETPRMSHVYVVTMFLWQYCSLEAYSMPLSLWQELLSHLGLYEENRYLMETLKEKKEFSSGMLYSYGAFTQFYYDSGLYRESEKIARQWVVACVLEYGPEEAETLNARAWLSDALCRQDKFEESFHIDREVLKVRRKKNGPEDPVVLNYTHSVACSLMERGHLVRAERIFRRVIEIEERVLGQDHEVTLAGVFALGHVFRKSGKYADAEALLRNVVHDGQRIFGSNHRNTIAYLHQLAWVLKFQGKYSESLTCLESVYAHHLTTLGPNNPETLELERDCVETRKDLELQLQREQKKDRRGSSASQNSDSESDTESEVSELGEESIFSTYERNLLCEEEYEEEDEEEDADSIIGTKSDASDIQIPETLKDRREASEESVAEE
ncbi:hypothetical protein BOTNAR_0039g00030 [Botryotinia narcissicola]|uniref:NB-ARC domain-containing protein n=1 Tax=Botryotinia narcissicola TaxID=278944 RepID=A0A4Z1JEZ8_9HELO|nr:hypothetical protein BOTNAR_0039g00030 [Botryotinia narcissicola]